MMVWLVVLTLLVAATTMLIWPLWRHTEHPLPAGVDGLLEDADQERHEEKKRLLANLRTLRLDHAEGKIAEEDFHPLEAEYQQQLATLLEGDDHTRVATPVVPRPLLHRFGSLALLVLVCAISLLLFTLYWKKAPDTAQAQMPDIDTMIQRLEARLATNPNDIKGQTMLARSYANLGRNDDALKAWHKVFELEPGNIEAQGGIALLLLQSGSEGDVREALTHIAQLQKAEPNEPAWLWYQAMGQNLLGQDKEARATLEKMLPTLPPESEKAAMVREALEQLKPAK